MIDVLPVSIISGLIFITGLLGLIITRDRLIRIFCMTFAFQAVMLNFAGFGSRNLDRDCHAIAILILLVLAAFFIAMAAITGHSNAKPGASGGGNASGLEDEML
jgi:NADH:ubiquinone oxidoreductase subunit K